MTEWVDRSTGEVIDLTQPDGAVRALLAQQHNVERLDDRLENLVEQVDRLTDADAGGDLPAATGWAWRDLGPVGARILWDRLGAWVGWLRGRYPVAQQVPPCWWAHPELVEELTALWLAWRAAYSDPAAPMTMPAEWHDRWLPGCLQRVRSWGVHCDGEHRSRTGSVYDARAVDDREAWSAYVAADVEARRERPRDEGGGDAPPRVGAAEMLRLLGTGQAVAVGSLPGSPVEYEGAFWLQTPQGWLKVTDPTIEAELRRDADRLRRAAEATDSRPDESGDGES